jgi:hypothetical protein
MLADNRVSRVHATNADQPSLLAGMIRDHHDRPLSPRHARKGSLRYRYYVSRDTDARSVTTPPITRIAAGPVETAVTTALHRLCNDPAHLLQHLCHDSSQVHQLDQAMQASYAMAARIPTMAPSPLRAMLLDLDLRLATDGKTGTACLSAKALAHILDVPSDGHDDQRIALELPALAIQRGHEQRLAMAPTHHGPAVTRDARLVTLIVRAHQARDMLHGTTISASPALTCLAPDIITAILQGTQPPSLAARQMLRLSEIPLAWQDQRRMLGFG